MEEVFGPLTEFESTDIDSEAPVDGSSGAESHAQSEEDALHEVDVSSIAASETVYIRPRTELCYEMYRNAMQKAKSVRNLALSAFMEAKRIKDLYMLDDIRDGDGDAELDEDSFSQMEPTED
jgi:hypothetical protein